MKVTIEKYYSNNPINHLSKVKIMIDEKQLTLVDGAGCEFVSEAEAIMDATAKTALIMAKALNCDVVEEKTFLNV